MHSSFKALCLIADYGRGMFVCTQKLYLEEMFIVDKLIEATAADCVYDFRHFHYKPEQWGPSYTPTWYDGWTWIDFDRNYIRLLFIERDMLERGQIYKEWDINLPPFLDTARLKEYGEWCHDIDIIQKAKRRFRSYWCQVCPEDYNVIAPHWNFEFDVKLKDQVSEIMPTIDVVASPTTEVVNPFTSALMAPALDVRASDASALVAPSVVSFFTKKRKVVRLNFVLIEMAANYFVMYAFR